VDAAVDVTTTATTTTTTTRLLFQQQQQQPPPPETASEPWGLPLPRLGGRHSVTLAAAALAAALATTTTPPKRKRRNKKGPTGGGGTVGGDSGRGDDENNGNNGDRPEYDGGAKALDVFSDPFFYDGDARMAKVVAYKRAEFFSAETTVDDVRRQYAGKPGGLLALARAIKASDLRLRAYFAAVPATTEQVLDDLGIIPLNEPSEVATFRQRYIEGLPSVEALREADGAPDSRSMALCFVTGSSGSGKTFFSLSALREFRNDLGNPLSLVLYLRTGILKVDYSDVGSAPGAIVRTVQTLLNKYLTRSRKRKVDFRRGEKLAMHVCLVLDECSAPRVGPFFERDNMSTVQELIAMLESEVADSVTLVAAGTGTLGSTYDSKEEAHFFRMKQWGPEDLRSVLEHFKAKRRMGKVTTDTLHLKAHETADTLANAINAHPWLAALTTNGRSTYFLCDTIANLSQQFTGRKVSWYVALGEWTPSLVERVLYRYTSSNGLHDLEAGAKAAVAALAFAALDRATSAAVLPDFGGLDASERRAVELLLESNVVVADDRTERRGSVGVGHPRPRGGPVQHGGDHRPNGGGLEGRGARRGAVRGPPLDSGTIARVRGGECSRGARCGLAAALGAQVGFRKTADQAPTASTGASLPVHQRKLHNSYAYEKSPAGERRQGIVR
jgi:hypothetical protein